MGFFQKYIVLILVIFAMYSFIFAPIYTSSQDANKSNITLDNAYYNDIANKSNELQDVLTTDVSADPSDATDVASWFGKSLAVMAVVLQLLGDAVLGSVAFVLQMFSVVASLPAPWNVVGGLVGLVAAGLTIVLVLKVFSALFKWDL